MWIEAMIFISVLLLGCWVYYFYAMRNNEIAGEMSQLAQVLSVHQDVRKILLAGLYQRFHNAEQKSRQTGQSDEFERFCAKVLQHALGGQVNMASEIHEGSVDIIHELDQHTYIGQTCCVPPDQPIDYEPIALLHSMIVRSGAHGGFIITTSSFTERALEYAADVNIRLFDGEQLLDMWIERVRNTEARIGKELGFGS